MWERIRREWPLWTLFGLLVIVAAAAAVLSFDALRSLAELAGFSHDLSWLLPITIDAGAAAGTVAWLTTRKGSSHVFGRALALVLLSSSIVGNAGAHYMIQERVLPPWWFIAAISAVAPAVLGGVVHLAVLFARYVSTMPVRQPGDDQDQGSPSPTADFWGNYGVDLGNPGGDLGNDGKPGDHEAREDKIERLIGEGYGRIRLARALEIGPEDARKLIDAHRKMHSNNGDDSDAETTGEEVPS
jgi:Protein of unknown function (DUF2637)